VDHCHLCAAHWENVVMFENFNQTLYDIYLQYPVIYIFLDVYSSK